MSFRSCAILFVGVCLGSACAAVGEKKPTGILSRHSAPAEVAPPAPAAPVLPDDLTQYYVALITKGPKWNAYDREEVSRIQAAHMQNMQRLAALGKLLVGGPFSDEGEWRGIFIFKCASFAEARELSLTDPAVRLGRFQIEVHPWITEKGAIRDAEFAAKK